MEKIMSYHKGDKVREVDVNNYNECLKAINDLHKSIASMKKKIEKLNEKLLSCDEYDQSSMIAKIKGLQELVNIEQNEMEQLRTKLFSDPESER